ncbi:TPR repeat containing exported protein; Putative periplasmic protein contains a protein prenylyltransferase domain [hydrothermal vent metagenome]|uniref:TPR repeat containing exported protein Putative periplasmic protein contains a protein prenylyltransferase domain n=1 Tax=hydrothermal vent metagenome TaxID=652676 RepID=A0A3B1E5E3_9ZZZZ
MTLKYESSELALENNKKEIEFLKSKIEKLDKTLVLLAKQIDKQYVTKKEFNKLVKFINKQVPDNKQKTRKVKHKKTNKSNKTLLSEAKKLFEKRLFKKSKRIFTKLIEKKYKPAVCNFYLGEIWFFRKKYKDAIYRFKTSMTLYSKANYIPKLLLHSAISFEKTNDLKNARNFYETLIDVYPGTKEAQEAQNKLSQIH